MLHMRCILILDTVPMVLARAVVALFLNVLVIKVSRALWPWGALAQFIFKRPINRTIFLDLGRAPVTVRTRRI